LVPALVGFVVAVGTFGLFGLRLDPVSAAMAPLILGIGLDDGLHAVHGETIAGTLRGSLGFSGSAMVMTTLTTCAGFGGLLFSKIPALRSAGALVAIGTLACLAATLLLLPAIEALGRSRGEAS
jgi:predicted RND superfamily exporter protein